MRRAIEVCEWPTGCRQAPMPGKRYCREHYYLHLLSDGRRPSPDEVGEVIARQAVARREAEQAAIDREVDRQIPLLAHVEPEFLRRAGV